MTPRARLPIGILLLSLATAMVSAPAWAADGDKATARRHYKKGVSQYNLGRFEDAIGDFERAYELDPSPILLWNIAQSHRKLGHAERAIFFYRRYLEEAPNAKDRRDVEKRIRELEQDLQREAPPTRPAVNTPPPFQTGPSTPVDSAPAQPPPSSATSTTTTLTSRPAPQGSSDGAGLRIGGLVTAGAGAAIAGLGLAFGLKARSDSDDQSKAARFDASRYDSGRRAETIQWVCYGVGGAALVTGGVLYYLGQRAPTEKASIMPHLTAGGAAVTVQGRF